MAVDCLKRLKRVPLLLSFLISALLSGSLFAGPILPGQGVEFSQVSFTHPSLGASPTNYGLMTANYSAISSAPGGGSLGFLNVSTTEGWVVQNLPVDLGLGPAGLSVLFDLGGSSGSLPARVEFSADPASTFAAAPTDNFILGTVEQNGEGVQDPVLAIGVPPAPNSINFGSPALGFEFNWQPGHVTLEEDVNQCAPGSLARSFQYLENRYGINVPHDNIPGKTKAGKADPANSLVAQIDEIMGRAPGARVGYGQIMNGKLDYLGNNGLGGLIIKHHRVRAANVPIPAGDYTSPGGVTSDDQTAQAAVAWLLGEIKKGEDVEFVYANAHMVNIVGGGTILGIPWIAIQDDAAQGKPGGTSFAQGGLRFTFLTEPGGILNTHNLAALNGRRDINLITSESVPEPSTFLLIISALAGAGTLRFLRRFRSF